MQHILITGASGNLGKSLVSRFLGAGSRVTAIVIPNDPVRLEPGSPLFSKYEADLNDEAGIGQVVDQIVRKHGDIHVAVLTAGGFAMGDIRSTGSAEIMKQYRLNVETAYHVARPVFLHMKERRYGRIFMVGSRPGLDMLASKNMVAYGLSKSLIFRLAEILNESAEGANVVSSVIVPSIIDTPQNRESMPDADFSAWMDPDKIAEIVGFYSSPAADGLREPVLKVYNKA
jgi:NAD(P)-dependent dehydrogenase (short-subunit alcohol dehydrogenase family)